MDQKSTHSAKVEEINSKLAAARKTLAAVEAWAAAEMAKLPVVYRSLVAIETAFSENHPLQFGMVVGGIVGLSVGALLGHAI